MEGGGVIAFNANEKTFSVVSDDTHNIPNAENPLYRARSIAFDKTHSRYLVSVGEQDPDASKHVIYAVDRNTGMRTVFSSNTVGTGDPFSALLADGNTAYLEGLTMDNENQRVLVCEKLSNKIFSIDLVGGNRSLVFNATSSNADNATRNCDRVAIVDSSSYALVVDPTNYYDIQDRNYHAAIVATDLVTGHRVIFSR
jgi:hypothetical protein